MILTNTNNTEGRKIVKHLDSLSKSIVLGTCVIFSYSVKRKLETYPSRQIRLAYFYTLEYWVESRLDGFDSVTGGKVKPYLNGRIYAANPLLYQFMRQINLKFFRLGGKKSI